MNWLEGGERQEMPVRLKGTASSNRNSKYALPCNVEFEQMSPQRDAKNKLNES